MAMPMRPAVLLQSRKSAAAGRVDETRTSTTSVLNSAAPAASLGRIACLISRSNSPSRHRSVNDDGAEISDVRKRRTRHEEIADAVEKPRGIVVGEKGGGIEAGGSGPYYGGFVDKGAGRVIRAAAAAVGSVGIGGHGRDSLGAVERVGGGQWLSLVWG